MSNLFYDKKFKDIIEEIDISKWNVSNVTNMANMFYDCTYFTGKVIENWDVSKVKDISGMFNNCYKFNCDLSNWNVSNVENMSFAFFNCRSLKNKPSWYKE